MDNFFNFNLQMIFLRQTKIKKFCCSIVYKKEVDPQAYTNNLFGFSFCQHKFIMDYRIEWRSFSLQVLAFGAVVRTERRLGVSLGSFKSRFSRIVLLSARILSM